jgi:formylglycine-generating enzyme required for sulfatase activity
MKKALLIAALAVIGSWVFTQERIAVFPFEDMEKVLTINQMVMFYQEFSNEFTNKSTGKFSVVPRQEVERLINTEAAFQLSDFSARAKTAEMQRVLNGTQILSGRIGKLDNKIRIIVSLYTYPELVQLRGGTTLEVVNVRELFDKIPELVQKMQNEIAGGNTGQKSRDSDTPANFVRIEGGTFQMGSPRTEAHRDRDETQHQVTVNSFYMSEKEVTLGEYLEVMQFNPNGLFQGANLPVINVNWYSAIEYCNARSIAEGLTPVYNIFYDRRDPNNLNTYDFDYDRFLVTWDKNANGYRLPTEAEWEYACRAGTNTAYNTGNGITTNQAHYNFSEGVANPVGNYPPNQWGLYDMHGNVNEWCWDWYGEYETKAQIDPSGPVSGRWRVAKGGSWRNRKPQHLRSAYRFSLTPTWYGNMGIRLVRSITSAQQPQRLSTVTNVDYSLKNAQRKASRISWQVAIFGNENYAYALRTRLENAGIDISTFFVEKTNSGNWTYYRVIIGENLAGTTQIQLYHEGYQDAFRRE